MANGVFKELSYNALKEWSCSTKGHKLTLYTSALSLTGLTSGPTEGEREMGELRDRIVYEHQDCNVFVKGEHKEKSVKVYEMLCWFKV